MSNILIIYASTTGNTEIMAEVIADKLKESNEVTVKSFDFDYEDISEIDGYDAVLIGTHSWDDGSLPYEVEDFYDEVEDADLSNKWFGVFGSGDSLYEYYGGAIHLMGDHLEALGA